jgi:hypothetical protein
MLHCHKQYHPMPLQYWPIVEHQLLHHSLLNYQLLKLPSIINKIKNLPVTETYNQSWAHMRASMLSLFKEFLTADSVLPLVENLDSDATVDVGTVRMSRVSRDKTEYLGTLNFHHARMSNSSSKPASFPYITHTTWCPTSLPTEPKKNNATN